MRVLVHELAHARAVTTVSMGAKQPRSVVETAAVIVCGALGLDTSGVDPIHRRMGEACDLKGGESV